MSKPLTIFGSPVDEGAVKQINNVMEHERAVAGALMADHHLGYSMPIGGVVAYDGAISPTGVGFDIGCGNMAVRTNLNVFDFGVDDNMQIPVETLKPIMRQIQKNVAFGMGRARENVMDEELLSHELWLDDTWKEIDKHWRDSLWVKARAQLGTVGSGNHYVDLLVSSTGAIWVANHFGSRGLGHGLASGFMAAAAGHDFTERIPEGEDAVVLETGTYLGDFYVEAMQLAGAYAYAGREYVTQQVLNILGAQATFTVHNHHNYAWLENGLWVVRKGATPLTTEPAYIGGSMGEGAVIVRGITDVGHVPNPIDLGNLGSAPHGSGRVMSRTKAAGKMRKMWICPNRNCDFEPVRNTGPEAHDASGVRLNNNHCPCCGIPLKRVRTRDASTAAINWNDARAELQARGIVVLGAGADESPGVYKNLGDVMAAHANIEIMERLMPLGVVMAGDDVVDYYKD